MPRPVRSEISRSEERPPISTATFTPTSFGIPSRGAKAREAAITTEKLGDDGKLGAVRAPGERGARRLEQLATLQSECSTDGLNRGFKPLPAPLRKRLELVPECAAERARLRRVQHGARIGV